MPVPSQGSMFQFSCATFTSTVSVAMMPDLAGTNECTAVVPTLERSTFVPDVFGFAINLKELLSIMSQ